MANYRAISSGLWSNLAIWQDNSSGSFIASVAFPGVNDDVYSNNFNVTIDVNFSIRSLRNTSATSIIAGGGYLVNNGVSGTVSFECISGGVVLISPNGLTSSFTIASGLFRTTGSGNMVNNTGTNNTVTLIGSGQNDSPTQMMRNANAGTLNLIGNYTANPTSSLGYAIQNAGSGTINITGNVLANGLGFGIFQNGNGTVTQVGELYSSSAANGLNSAGATAINILSGPFYNIGNKMAVYATNMQLLSTSITFWSFNTNVPLTNKILWTSDNVGGVPVTSDVRQGTIYGISNDLVGTLAVPSPSNVRKGVPTDNTVGTADLTAADFWDYLSVSATTVGSMGEIINRIPLNPASVQSTGAQIASFNT
jgi:hypothetical protein